MGETPTATLIAENDWNYEGTLTTVKEYMEKNPPAVHKQKDHEPAR